MTLTVDFDALPRTIYATAGSAVKVRFVDKSVSTNGVVNSWIWKFGQQKEWIPDGLMNNTRIDVLNNPGINVNDRVVLSTSGTLPTGLSSSVVYWVKTATTLGGYRILTLSLTQGGAAVSYSDLGTGSFYVEVVRTEQNPVVTFTVAVGTISPSLTCNDSGGTGNTTTTKTAWIVIQAGTFSPPSPASAYRNISLFVYERSSETSPKSTCICRTKTGACNLYYQNLTINGAITKAGKATFQIVNSGSATADEIDLFESGTVGRYKNIAIVAGYDVIWSGKITKADKELKSLPGTSPQKAVYTCEAYSDIRKLSDWNVISGNRGTQTQTPGRLTALILATNSGEPDFVGTRGGFIDYSGAKISQTLADIDKLTAFTTLTSATDYDWRTRMETMLFQYATFNGTDTVTITSAGLTAGALVGNWLLFPTENYLNSGVSAPNYIGILAWGIITANTTTTITATLAGASTIPTTTDNCLVVQIPRLDISNDLAEPTAVRSFTNNVNMVKFSNSDNKDDLFTKVVVKGTPSFIPQFAATTTGTNNTISTALAAKDAINAATNFFNNSALITYKTQGYVYATDVTNKYIYLLGQDYALKVNDIATVSWVMADGSIASFTNITISAITLVVYSDGTLCTRLTINAGIVSGISQYAIFCLEKLYVTDNSIVTATYPSHDVLNCGSTFLYAATGGTDATYGQYITFMYGGNTPHYPGCLLSKQTYSEASPESGSPVQVNGIVSRAITMGSDTTLPDLEVAAVSALIQGCVYYQKSSAMVSYYQWTANRVRDGVQITKPAFIREGQRISVVPYTGATAIERQVVEWTLDTMTMILSVTLGDYVKDVWNYLDRNTAATQKSLI